MEKTLKEIEVDNQLEVMNEKYSEESVDDFLKWLLTFSEADLNATAELYMLIDRVEISKQNESYQPRLKEGGFVVYQKLKAVKLYEQSITNNKITFTPNVPQNDML